jgi:hypothetical protein
LIWPETLSTRGVDRSGGEGGREKNRPLQRVAAGLRAGCGWEQLLDGFVKKIAALQTVYGTAVDGNNVVRLWIECINYVAAGLRAGCGWEQLLDGFVKQLAALQPVYGPAVDGNYEDGSWDDEGDKLQPVFGPAVDGHQILLNRPLLFASALSAPTEVR